MDTTTSMHFLLSFLYITHGNCGPVDYSAEAFKVLTLHDIKEPTTNEKRMAKMVVIERNNRAALMETIGQLKQDKKLLEMELCLRPLLEKAQRLVIPYWLLGMPLISPVDMWLITLELELTPEGKLLVEALRSRNITIKDFAEAIEILFGKLSEGVCHKKGVTAPKDYKEEDWEKIYKRVGVDNYRAQESLKMIVTIIDLIDQNKHLKYTTTTQLPTVGRDFVILFGNLPFKSTDSLPDRKKRLLEWFGVESGKGIDKLFFPWSVKTKFINGAFIRLNNVEDDSHIIKMITNLKTKVAKRHIKYMLYANKGYATPLELLEDGGFFTEDEPKKDVQS